MSLILYIALFSGMALLFAILLRISGAIEDASTVASTAQQSLQLMRDPALSDRQKEKAMQAASGRLFGKFLLISLKCLLALAAPALILATMVWLELASSDALQQAALNWVVITLSSLVAVVTMLIRR